MDDFFHESHRIGCLETTGFLALLFLRRERHSIIIRQQSADATPVDQWIGLPEQTISLRHHLWDGKLDKYAGDLLLYSS